MRTLLAGRGVIALAGPDARALLQGLVTNDVDGLDPGHAVHAALLTPQGKILTDFFVVADGERVLLDTPRGEVPGLVKRLTLYRLRRSVEITDLGDSLGVMAAWGDTATVAPGGIAYPDPRHAGLGIRAIAPRAALADTGCDETGYHQHRIALGVPEGGRDYVFGDTFPHEALLDQLNGVSFTKGCYVGQEIVSRMQHRGTARKRIVRLVSEGPPLPAPGCEIRAGEIAIGTLGTTSGAEGLALVRLDRAAELLAQGRPLTAGDVRVAIDIPPWATFRLG